MNANVVKAELSDEKPHFCAKCDKRIQDRYFLKALNLFWHEDCLKCGCCDCRLGDVGTTLLYGNTGLCSACNKLIPAFEMVMRAKRNVYHLECFACQQCSHRFCVGDRFYLCDNKILCESDYEDRQMHQSLQQANKNVYANRTNSNNNNSNMHNLNQNLKSSNFNCSPVADYPKSTKQQFATNNSNMNSSSSMSSFQNNNDFLSYDIRHSAADIPIGVR